MVNKCKNQGKSVVGQTVAKPKSSQPTKVAPINGGNVFYAPIRSKQATQSYLSTKSGSVYAKRVKVGSIVKLYNETDGEKETYKIIPENITAQDGVLSIATDFGKMLIGKQIGDRIKLEAPDGIYYFEITDIC